MKSINQLLHRLRQFVLPQHLKEHTVENNTPILYTEEQLMARLKFFIGICLALTLTGIVFVVLYSLIFVTQPLNAISPIDQKFFELIVPIATFLTGTLSGIMLAGGDKDAQKSALQAANKGWDKPPSPTPPSGGSSNAFGTTSSPVQSFGGAAFGSPAPSSFSSASTGFGASPAYGAATASFPAAGAPSPNLDAVGAVVPGNDFGSVQVGFGGKKAPPEFPQPLI
jgi:hypothetical protein